MSPRRRSAAAGLVPRALLKGGDGIDARGAGVRGRITFVSVIAVMPSCSPAPHVTWRGTGRGDGGGQPVSSQPRLAVSFVLAAAGFVGVLTQLRLEEVELGFVPCLKHRQGWDFPGICTVGAAGRVAGRVARRVSRRVGLGEPGGHVRKRES